MELYTYLEENLSSNYCWEDYTFDDSDIPEIKGNLSLLCDVWDAINEWATEYADNCRGVDAALIAKILNETISLINSYTAESPLDLSAVADLCSIYGRCCVFAKHVMGGSEYFSQCQFIVNNTISGSITSRKNPCIELDDIKNCTPEKDCWENL